MSTIGNPMKIPELDLKPEPTGGIQLSENMQQVLSLLTCFWRNKRVLIKASPSGVMFVTGPQIKGIKHITVPSPNYAYQGENIECSEVMVMGHPENAGRIWVTPHVIATAGNGWPLDKGNVIGFSITNLNMLNLLVITQADTAIIAYTL